MIITSEIINCGNYEIKLIKFIHPYIEAGSTKILIEPHEKFCLSYIERTPAIFVLTPELHLQKKLVLCPVIALRQLDKYMPQSFGSFIRVYSK